MGRQVLVAADQVQLAIPLPDGAQEEPTSPVDLSAVPGAKLALQRAYRLPGGGAVELVCATAAADLWVPGLEGAVLAGASAMVRERAGLSALSSEPIESVAGHWQQSFAGSAAQPSPVLASGRHVLGFVGADRDALVCSLVCSAPPPADPCFALSAGLEVRGPLGPPPEPGMGGAMLSWAAAHPLAALLIAGAVGLMVVAQILIRRPRPAW